MTLWVFQNTQNLTLKRPVPTCAMSLALGELAYPLDETIQEFFRAWQDEDVVACSPAASQRGKAPLLSIMNVQEDRAT
jgi:hypothetical protein